jgi:hypothetical protein
MVLMDKQPGVFIIIFRLSLLMKIHLLVFMTIVRKKNFLQGSSILKPLALILPSKTVYIIEKLYTIS